MEFSIVIPVKDDERIFSLLDKLAESSHRDEFEIIVSCNGSLTEFVKRIRAKAQAFPHYKILESDKPCPSKAINFASHHVSTDKFLILDSDCVLSDQFIPVFLSQNSGDVSRGHIVYRGSTKFSRLTADWRQAVNQIVEQEGRLYTPGLMISKKLFHSIGGFSEALRFSYDSDFSDLAMKKGYRATIINDAVLYHDCHTNIGTEMKIWQSYGRGRYSRMSTHWQDMNTLARLNRAVFGDLPLQEMKKSWQHMAYGILYTNVRFSGFLKGIIYSASTLG